MTTERADESTTTLELPTDIQVNPLDARAPTKIVIEAVKRILGGNVHVFLAGTSIAKPQRLAELGRFGYMALRWSDLKPKQVKELGRILQYRPDDLCRYGDTVVCVASTEAVRARQQYKAMRRNQAMRRQIEGESVAALQRELGGPGVEITDT